MQKKKAPKKRAVNSIKEDYMFLTDFLRKEPKWFHTIVGFLLVILIGYIDYITGSEIAFSIFYLIPVMMVAWFAGKKIGFVIAFLSAVTWFLADYCCDTCYSHWFIPYWNSLIRLGFFLIITYIMSKLNDLFIDQEKLAQTDTLTGIANGRSFYKFAESEINRAVRYHHPFAIAYVDLDNFKSINDVHGHSTGDKVLQMVASTIQKNVRSTDIVARLGGDEFVILLTETDPDNAPVFIEKIQKAMLDTMQIYGWPVTFSIGTATFVSPPGSVDEMVKTADNIMYYVKKSGKNMVKYEKFGQVSIK